MAKVSEYRCKCGKQKTEANRWLLGCVIGSGWLNFQLMAEVVCLRPWHEGFANEEGVLHFCSDFCALKWQAEMLGRMGR